MGSPYTLAAATAIFVGTYVLMSFRNLGRFPLDRPAVALLGGALMLLAGVLTPQQAVGAINLDVILLLVGMMLLVSGLEVCGFFDLVSTRIAERATNQVAFLAGLMVATAFLSALVLNDAIALLMTPIVVRSAKSLKVKPGPTWSPSPWPRTSGVWPRRSGTPRTPTSRSPRGFPSSPSPRSCCP